jgi:tetratricopeptide (TPR) repeat protein
LRLDPQDTDALGKLADLWVEQRSSTKAIQRVHEYVSHNDSDAVAHTILGSVLIADRQYSQAEAEFRRAIELDPQTVTPFLKLGKLYQDQNQVDLAIGQYNEAMKRSPGMAAIPALVGNLYLAKNDLSQARKFYEQSLAVEPDFAIAASNLALVYIRQGADLDQALQLAEKARQLMPQLDSIADTLAWVRYHRREYRAAIPLLTECIDKAPANSLCHYHLGMVLIAAGETAKGREELHSALKLQLPAEDADHAHAVLAQLR